LPTTLNLSFRNSNFWEPIPIRVVPRKRSRKNDVDMVQGDANTQLLMEAKQIAREFLERSGEIDDPVEVNQFLTGKIEHMIGQGQRNRLALSNRAIAAFKEYRRHEPLNSRWFRGERCCHLATALRKNAGPA
jgi:hypothetical protein